jgi:hypothetical protein
MSSRRKHKRNRKHKDISSKRITSRKTMAFYKHSRNGHHAIAYVRNHIIS